MCPTICRPSLTTVARARRALVAALAALTLMAAAGAPAAGAMPPGGYHSEPEPSELPEPIQAPKPHPPAVYCVTASPTCGNAFDVSASNATTSKLGVSWSGASGYTGYVVERRKTDLGGSFGEVTRLGGTARDYTDVGLTDNTSYDYRVTATGNNGSASSRIATARTLPAPTILSASRPTTRTVDLRWSATTGATGYTVERRESTTGSFVAVKNLGEAARGYTDEGLAHSTGYDYRVRATGVAGLEPSNVVAVRTLVPQVERVRLSTDWDEQFRFEVGLASTFAPAGAKILGVRNVAVDMNRLGLRVVGVEHTSSDLVMRKVSELGYNATTSAFNGQLAKGSWSLRVAPASALFLWDCLDHEWDRDWCSTVADVVLEVTWA
jgi:hypothetical protein